MQLIAQPEAGFDPILRAIRKAKRVIDVTIFRLDRKEIAEALGQAVTRGVRVRALVAHTNRGGEANLRKLEQDLLGRGLLVSRTADDLVKYHGKFMVIDDTLHVLGFNFTRQDIARRSFAIQSRDRRAVRDALALFESDITKQPFEGPERSPLVVSPVNSRAALRQFVARARRELLIYDARLDDPEFIRLLKARAAAGVSVQVIGAARKLEGSGVVVRPLKGLKLHVRAAIRDGTRAFVGSQSLRQLELDRRREVGLIITNPSVARQMREVFQHDWECSAKGDKEAAEADDAKSKAKAKAKGKRTKAKSAPAAPPPKALVPAGVEVGAQQ